MRGKESAMRVVEVQLSCRAAWPSQNVKTFWKNHYICKTYLLGQIKDMVRDTRKIVQALNYIACSQLGHTVNCMKAYKLLWLADRYHLRHYGRTISGDVYYALPHGPVPMDAMNVVEGKPTNLADGSEGVTYIRKCKRYNITSLVAPKMDVFSVSDKEALDCVIEAYGKKTWTELSDFSHTFPEWKEYESKLGNPYLKKGYPIDMILFFENRPKEDAIFREPKELLELSKELYLESA